ncbi:MAG: hypothetical protein WAL29_08670 [Bacteroidales bacterium]
MTKYLRQVSVILFFSVVSFNISAQGTSGFLDRLAEKFQSYCKTFPWEEIYIHTDREDYIAGEDLWFNIYLIDRQSNKPSSASSIAYFEILNSENRPVIQKRIKLENGSGPGEIILPDTLSSGIYTIRAYTNMMKNFLPSNCFMKEITLYNALTHKSFKGISNKPAIPPVMQDNSSVTPGFKFRVNIPGKDIFEIEIETDRSFRSLNGSMCYLFIQTHGLINFKGAINLPDDVTRKILPGEIFIPGINQILIFNETGKLIAEKYNYTPFGESANVTVSGAESFIRREKISLEIKLDEELISSAGSQLLGLSVAEPGDKAPQDLGDYMIFGSEFGVLPDEIRNSRLSEIPPEKLERFLATLKSRWIDINSILTVKPVLKYDRETVYHYLNGRLIPKNPGGSMIDNFLFLSIPGKHATFQYAKTDKDGKFFFRLPVNEHYTNLIIQPEFTEKDLSVRIESPYSEIYPEFLSVIDTLPAEYQMHISRLGANYQVEKIYGIVQQGAKTEKTVFSDGSRRFYGKPDIELIMDDYIKLPVMQEVFFELMPGVFMKKRRSVYEITVADPVDKRIFEKPPILFVDGVVIKDPAIIANIDPETVEEIDAIKERYLVGDYLFYGLINVITRAGDFSGIDLPDYAVRLPYRVIDPVKTFSSPDYSDPVKKQSRLPDFRNTLYWNPAVKVDAEGIARIEFWASDFITDYVINIQGITPEGKPIAVRKSINIKDIR